ncbi:MAG: DNA primase, partial [Hydrogenophilales bacterium 16-62-9]
MIPRDFIDTLLARVDIVDVIDRRVPLKKAGQNYQACCPFHSEKTPSFTVSPTKQFYHCFGCGAHGTALGFLMEYEHMSFPDAVGALAQDVGLPVPESGESDRPKPPPALWDALEQAAQFYKKQLKQTSHAIDYLKRRGLTGAIAARYGIGYAPDGWSPLKQVFADYTADALAASGLVVDGDNRRYDRFRDRIMFPIRNAKGQIVGFGGRVLGQGEPKYLNSPETPLFHKGSELYGLFEARAAIKAAGRAIVVEGYMDVVALAQHGVEFAVAALGTATTPIHVRTLLRHTD